MKVSNMKAKLEAKKNKIILEIVQKEQTIKTLQSQLAQEEVTIISMRGGIVELTKLINELSEEEGEEGEEE